MPFSSLHNSANCPPPPKGNIATCSQEKLGLRSVNARRIVEMQLQSGSILPSIASLAFIPTVIQIPSLTSRVGTSPLDPSPRSFCSKPEAPTRAHPTEPLSQAKLGVETKELDDDLEIYGKPISELGTGVRVHFYDDHLVA